MTNQAAPNKKDKARAAARADKDLWTAIGKVQREFNIKSMKYAKIRDEDHGYVHYFGCVLVAVCRCFN